MQTRARVIAALILAASACTSSDSQGTSTSSGPTPSVTTSTSSTSSQTNSTISSTTSERPTTTTKPFEPFDVLAFGDAADCREPAENVAELVRETPGEVLIVGDLAYPEGSQSDFDNCFMPLYGDQLERLHTVPGDNDYGADQAALPYFETLGVEVAGNPGQGWWSFTREAWQVIGINSACSKVGFCGPNSPQYAFVQDAVKAEPDKCRLVVWHLPRFTSSANYNGLKNMGDLYQLLHDHGADILVVGNSHHYERFEPLGPDGMPDPKGIANFTVGTGGPPNSGFGDPLPGSVVRNNDTLGLVRFRLAPNSYSWEFLSAGEGGLEDSGTHSCHNRS